MHLFTALGRYSRGFKAFKQQHLENKVESQLKTWRASGVILTPFEERLFDIPKESAQSIIGTH